MTARTIPRHRVTRISPVNGYNVCTRCGRPARGIRRAGRAVTRPLAATRTRIARAYGMTARLID